MGFNLERGYVNCWSCGKHPLAETVSELTGKSRPEASKLVNELEEVEGEEEARVIRSKLVLPKGVKAMKKIHRDYLRSRNLDPDYIEKVWGTKGIGLTERFQNRIFIPITQRGLTVSWTTRAVSPKAKLRYVSASPSEEAINHKELLYGEELAGMAGLFVEGPFDVWNIGMGAMGTFGTGFLEAQVARMSRFYYRTICFDPEPAAQKRAKELMDMLSSCPGITQNVILDAEDPGSASPKERRLLRRCAKLD
jgi:DNA primase